MRVNILQDYVTNVTQMWFGEDANNSIRLLTIRELEDIPGAGSLKNPYASYRRMLTPFTLQHNTKLYRSLLYVSVLSVPR